MRRTSWAVPAAFLLALAAATGCGKSGTKDLLTLQILGASPADGATNVSVTTTTITVFADRELDSSTISGASVYVNEGGTGGLVQGTVAYSSASKAIVWTLTQTDLNPFFSGQAVLNFETRYTITVTTALRSKQQHPLGKTFQSSFTTLPFQFSVVAIGSDPVPGTTTALVDPFRREVNGKVYETTLQFAVDVPLDPATVTASGNVIVTQGGSQVPGTVRFDAASNTILWTPQGSANPNPAFPGEPLLLTGTSYVCTLTTGLRATSSTAIPATSTAVAFTTLGVAIRSPQATTGVADLLLNEVLANPGTLTANGDSNGDGTIAESQDEFVEIVNVSSDYLNLNGLKIRDYQANTFFEFTLATGDRHRALLAPGKAVIVYGGASSSPSAARLVVGHSKVFWHLTRDTSSGSATFNNTSTDRVEVVSNGGTTTYMVGDWTVPPPDGSSYTRNPDVTGALTDHATVTPGVNFTPGTKVGGQVFP